MRSFTTAYAVEVEKKRGAQPLWILSLVSGGSTYYLADVAVTITGWKAQPVTTLAWISEWGELNEQMSGDLNEIRVADFSATCLVDPEAVTDINDLVLNDIETGPAKLWLWFRNLNPITDPPYCIFTGHVKDCSGDAYAVRLDLEDDTFRLFGNLGAVAGQAQFPAIDTDDVGKLLPIVYGSVEKLPCINIVSGALTSLTADITAATTTLPVTDGLQFHAGDSIQIDAEIMTVSTVAASTLTVVRGQGLTAAVTHQASAVVWERVTAFVYLVADHPVNSIDTVYGVVDKQLMDVTAYCTKYTGQSGQQLPPYGARAVVTIAGLIVTPQAVALTGYTGGTIALSGAVALVGSIDGGTADALTGNIQDYGVTTGSHAHSAPNIVSQSATNVGGVPANSTWTAFFSPFVGTVTSCTVSVAIYSTMGTATVYINGMAYSVPTTPPTTFTLSAYSLLNLVVQTAGITVVVSGAVRNITTPVVSDASAATGVSKTAANNGSLTVLAGSAASNGTLGTSGGYTLANSLTVGIAGNSVANTLVGTQLLADVTGVYSTPVDVVSNLLNYAGFGSATVQGTMPAGFSINGAITTQGRLIDWLDTIAFQCRCFFRMINGAACLYVRPTTLISAATISAVAVESGKSLLSWKRAPLTQIINAITARYLRDWSNSSAEPYGATSSANSAPSITRYGTQTKDNLFKWDFVGNQTMADTLVAFYLTTYATRRTYVYLVVYRDKLAISFGDIVTLPDTRVGIVVSCGIQPGSIDVVDKIKLTVMV